MIFLLVLKVDILILINNRPPTCLALIWVSVWMDARPQFSARARGMLSNASAYDLNTRTEQFWTALWHHNVNNGERWIEIENDKIGGNRTTFCWYLIYMWKLSILCKMYKIVLVGPRCTVITWIILSGYRGRQKITHLNMQWCGSGFGQNPDPGVYLLIRRGNLIILFNEYSR